MLSPKRKGRVTGSAAGAILGLSQYQTADDVLRRMVRDYHGAESEFTGNVATEYGSFHESGALFDFIMETGIGAESNSEFFIHPDNDWLGATPDGFVGDNDDSIIEIKCPYGLRNDVDPAFKTLAEHPHYFAQVQIEMYCTGKSQCYFYQWAPKGTKLEIVQFSQHWIDNNIVELLKFYRLFLFGLNDPAHLEPKRPIITNQSVIKMADEYDELSEAIERATNRKKEVLAEIVKATGNRDCDIQGRKLTMVEREGAISYAKAIKKYAPDADLDPFKGKPTKYWRLS